MEDFSKSKILEPIDSNSLSLISSSSGTGTGVGNVTNDSFSKIFTKSPHTTLLKRDGTNNNNGGRSFIGWQFDSKEFEFDSNSTPSKNGGDSGRQQFLHVRKRNSQLMGAKPRIPSRLHQSISKLDLLDENSLTSLPIPPPVSRDIPPRKRSKLNPAHEMRIHNDVYDRRISYKVAKAYARDGGEEESEDDSESIGHPIVMIEDYISPANDDQNKKLAKKRVSVSDLKNKMGKNFNIQVPLKLRRNTNRSMASTSSVTLIPHILGDTSCDGNNEMDSHDAEAEDRMANEVKDILQGLIKPNPPQEHDKYLSNITKNTNLRKCVICERPLYEISSLLANRDDFKEIVCGRCTEKYEEAVKIFEEYEFDSSCDTSKDTSMSSMDSVIRFTDNGTNPLRNKASFSQELISRLQWQLQANMKDDSTILGRSTDFNMMSWFIEAKKKIRWRWRVSGLLPHFLAKRYENKE